VQLTLQGVNFRPGALVVISPPLAGVNLSQANQSAPDIVVENISQLNNSLIIMVISVSPRAAPGLRAIDVVNADGTNTGAQPGLGSATSKPLNLTLANSLAAPLGVQTIAITQPRDGLVVAQGDDFFAEAILAGTGTGTITGEWLWDGVASEPFAVNMAGGQRVLLRTQRGLPTLWLGLHTVALRITTPNLLESRPIQVLINPGDWSTMRLLRPAPGARFAGATPPALKWLPVPGAALYQVGFSPEPYFSSIKAWHDVRDSEWAVPLAVWFALPDGEIYWTVRAVEMSGETHKPLAMRRLIKVPGKPVAGSPAGRGPAEGNIEAQQGQTEQKPAAQSQPQPKRSDAEPEPTPPPQQPPPPAPETPPPIFQSNQTQMSANSQWASGSAPDTSVLAFAQQTSYARGPWRAEINGSALLNALLGPEPQHALGRANNYVFRLAYDQPIWGLNMRFGVLAPALYLGSEFVTSVAARQGVEPSLRTRAGTFAFWTNTDDVVPGAGAGANFHQRLIGGSYEAPLPPAHALLRFMWLGARDAGASLPSAFVRDGSTLFVPTTLTPARRGDVYGGLLQIHLGPQWAWNSEYSWSNNNPDFTDPGSLALFGRAWRTGITGSRWKAQFVFNYRDVGPNFSTPANPALTPFGTPGRRGVDALVARPFRVGTFALTYQYLQSDLGQTVRPTLSLHNLSGGWTKNVTATTVASLQVHEIRTFTGETPLTSPPAPATRADTRDFGAIGSVNRAFRNFTLGVTGSRSWLRNRVFPSASVITSNVGINSNFRAGRFFQMNSNVGLNWIAADKNSVGGTRTISAFLQPMVLWQKAGLTVSPLITVGQTHSLLGSGVVTADTLSTQYAGRLGWQFPGRLKFSTLTCEGAQVRLRNGITGVERTDQRLLVLWTIVWARRTGT
jgi:hypothetical protein